MGFDRPLREIHFITGLADGRAAMYSRIHHAMVDGVAAMRLLQASLSTDPDKRDMPPPWAVRRQAQKAAQDREALAQRLMEVPLGAVRSTWALASEAAGMPSALVRTLNRGVRNESAPIALYAPRTILNQKITGSRRVAAQDWEIERMRAVGKTTGATINDVVLAMCAGALRHYLRELDGLPDQPLVAMVPMSLKLDQAGIASTDGGNAGMYPLSIPTHGQAMNITCTSYDGRMNVGLTGCRRSTPSLQRLLTHLDGELVALEEAAGV